MFELYKVAADTRGQMLSEKHAQVKYLYGMAADRENNVLIDNTPFTQAPRIFNRKITSNAVQTLICEVIEPLDYFEAGSILFYDNDYWLCTSSFVFHDNFYCRGEFYRCNYKLRWQKENGDIVERWVVTQDATAYSSGVSGNKILNYGADQQMIWITCDPETVIMRRDKRFFIDNNTVQPTPYKLTRIDTTTRTNKGVGYCIWLLNESQYDDDKDSIEHMLCDYIKPDIKPEPSFTVEYYGQPLVRIGGRNKSFTAITDNEVIWNLVASEAVTTALTLTVDGKTCYIKCAFNEALIGSTFKLVATAGGSSVETTINIDGGV